jgi:hypothetical protein
MFFRVQDFESSSIRLLQQLHKEAFAALKYLGEGSSLVAFSENMKRDGIRLHSHAKDSFDTYDLSPLLRHFLNDACRVLEPTVGLMQRKYPNISARAGNERIASFNEYLKRLRNAGITLNFDSDFFIAL